MPLVGNADYNIVVDRIYCQLKQSSRCRDKGKSPDEIQSGTPIVRVVICMLKVNFISAFIVRSLSMVEERGNVVILHCFELRL